MEGSCFCISFFAHFITFLLFFLCLLSEPVPSFLSLRFRRAKHFPFTNIMGVCNWPCCATTCILLSSFCVVFLTVLGILLAQESESIELSHSRKKDGMIASFTAAGIYLGFLIVSSIYLLRLRYSTPAHRVTSLFGSRPPRDYSRANSAASSGIGTVTTEEAVQMENIGIAKQASLDFEQKNPPAFIWPAFTRD